MSCHDNVSKENYNEWSALACSAGVKHHVGTSPRDEEMGRIKGSGEGAGREKRNDDQ